MDARTAAHVEACGECRDFTASLEPLRALLSDAAEIPPERVWQRLRAEATPRGTSWTRPFVAALAGAAAAFAIVITWPSAPGGGPSPVPSAVVRSSRDAGDPALSSLAGPGREDPELREVRLQLDYMRRDMSRF